LATSTTDVIPPGPDCGFCAPSITTTDGEPIRYTCTTMCNRPPNFGGTSAPVPASKTVPTPTTTPTPCNERTTMSRKASGLARLMTAIKSIDTDADSLAEQFEAQSRRVHDALAVTRQIVGTVKQAADDLEAVNGQYSNGGPTVDSDEPSAPAQG
jgi:hypothetical protein